MYDCLTYEHATNIVKGECRDKRKRMFSSLAMPNRILYYPNLLINQPIRPYPVQKNTAPGTSPQAVSFPIVCGRSPIRCRATRPALAPVRSGATPPLAPIAPVCCPFARMSAFCRHALGLRHQPAIHRVSIALRSQPATRPAAGQNERTPEYGKSGVLGLKIKTGIKRVSDG